MAEEKDGDEKKAEGDAPKKGGSKKLVLIIGGVILLIVAIGVPVMLFMKKGGDANQELDAEAALKGDGEALVAEGAGEEEELLEGEEPLGALFPMETFVVNLKGGRFLRLQAQVEFNERDVPKRFYTRMVPIRDAIIGILTQKTQEDVLSDKGKEDLKKELRDVINETLKREEVKRVFFTQFLVQ